MRLTDRALPAAQYLVGGAALDLLRLPIEASGGVLESARPVQVQYRPGSDVVVRYSAQVAWNGQPAKRETLVAASTIHGPHPGAVTLTATTHSGPVEVGVWRWPFDPVLVGLDEVVSVSSVATLLELDARELSVEIVAFRPTERAVVRVSRNGEAVAYVKVVAPGRAEPIAGRHERLRAAGVPAARIARVEVDRGLLVLEPLVGPTLRELAKGAPGDWPDPAEFSLLAAAMSSVELAGNGPASHLADGPLHTRMLAAVLPDHAAWLDEIADRLAAHPGVALDGTVHGDLHEGQVIVGGGRIIGLLDVDDAGPGASIDDRANLIARFRYRALTTPAQRSQLDAYAESLRADGARHHDVERLDVHTAAALAGLATGPFRIQSEGWRDTVLATMELVDRWSRGDH